MRLLLIGKMELGNELYKLPGYIKWLLRVVGAF